ncbi:MAG: hypothetical protein QM372_00855 [Bacillota bacterium]|jgi:disulfide oxidoreductase YuzD|nr:hypothetical protein [Bacillota bacterium]NLJ01936.1 hypothetical protein [Bacillota bacterium]
MPLGEAVVYLRRAVRRRVGPDVAVRMVNISRPGNQNAPWKDERPLPLVIIDGDVVFKGDFSIHKIVQEVADRYRR